MIDNQSVTICIPARYESERLPGKPLIKLDGIPMIVRVAQNMSQSIYADKVVVLTDDERIQKVVQEYQLDVMMTSPHHSSGTDRVIEYYSKHNSDIVVNVQGDEPLIKATQIDDFIKSIANSLINIVTTCKKINDATELFDYNTVKCIFRKDCQALYFSRQAIPSFREEPYKNWIKLGEYYKHIGIYGFKNDVLNEIKSLPLSSLETIEKLEQLRWLDNGLEIKCIVTKLNNFGIDTEDDITKYEKLVKHIL